MVTVNTIRDGIDYTVEISKSLHLTMYTVRGVGSNDFVCDIVSDSNIDQVSVEVDGEMITVARDAYYDLANIITHESAADYVTALAVSSD